MVTLTLEENEIDIILNLVNRKIEKINDKEIDENQIQTKKEFEKSYFSSNILGGKN